MSRIRLRLRAMTGAIGAVAIVLTTAEARADGDEPTATPARTAPPEYAPEPSPAAPSPTPRAPPPEYIGEPAPTPPPLGRRGFQMAVRSGIAIPIGSAKRSSDADAALPEQGSSSMSDLTSWQIPATLDIGGKPSPHLFIGGYVGLAAGNTGGRLSDACERLGYGCFATNVSLGAQIHYVIAPHEWASPWIGYGFGYSWLNAGEATREVSLRGFDFGHFLAGVDFRFSRNFGIGAFADFSIGSYSHRELSASPAPAPPPNTPAIDEDIRGRGFHQWLTIGPRLVLFP